MIARYSSAVIAGSATTFFLFFVMQTLIAMQPGAAGKERPRHIVEITKVRDEQDVRTKELNPIDERIKDFPQEPPRPVSDVGPADRVGVPVIDVPVPTDANDGLSFRLSDGPLVSIVRVQPVYPARPLSQGIEGWVVVEFDVQADGTVTNAFVVESSNRAFERSAVAAVLKFRYKPRVVDGVPQATTGMQNIFRFELENN